jgi:hypothetical protein
MLSALAFIMHKNASNSTSPLSSGGGGGLLSDSRLDMIKHAYKLYKKMYHSCVTTMHIKKWDITSKPGIITGVNTDTASITEILYNLTPSGLNYILREVYITIPRTVGRVAL